MIDAMQIIVVSDRFKSNVDSGLWRMRFRMIVKFLTVGYRHVADNLSVNDSV